MARPGWPERNRAARSFRQLRRFHHVSNSDEVFGTHRGPIERGTSDEMLRSDRSEMQIGLRAICTPITRTSCRDTRVRVSVSSEARIRNDLCGHRELYSLQIHG